MPNTALAEIGHNRPPTDAEILHGRLVESAADIVTRAKELAAAANRLPTSVQDENIAGNLAAFAKQITLHEKVVEDRRKAEKGVYDEMSRVVQTFFATLATLLAAAKAKANKLLLDYQREQQRIADEVRRAAEAEARRLKAEADRIAAEAQTEAAIDQAIQVEAQAAAAREQAAAVAAPAPIRSALGASAAIRRTLAYKIEDLGKVPAHLLMVNDAAVKAHMRTAGKGQLPATVPGLLFFWNETMVSR